MTDGFKKLKPDESGAASVLVIFMMLVLVTLGAFAITSANVNYKLSRRTIEWNNMYYTQDAKGEAYLQLIDAKLAEAETMACDYVKNKKYEVATQENIPDQLQTEIYNNFQEKKLQDNYGAEVIRNIYMYYALLFIKTLANSELEVYTIDKGAVIDEILTTINISSEQSNDELCGLNISIWVEPVEYVVAESNNEVSIVRANENVRYRIEDWYEYQEAIENEDTETELWDGQL